MKSKKLGMITSIVGVILISCSTFGFLFIIPDITQKLESIDFNIRQASFTINKAEIFASTQWILRETNASDEVLSLAKKKVLDNSRLSIRTIDPYYWEEPLYSYLSEIDDLNELNVIRENVSNDLSARWNALLNVKKSYTILFGSFQVLGLVMNSLGLILLSMRNRKINIKTIGKSLPK